MGGETLPEPMSSQSGILRHRVILWPKIEEIACCRDCERPMQGLRSTEQDTNTVIEVGGRRRYLPGTVGSLGANQHT